MSSPNKSTAMQIAEVTTSSNTCIKPNVIRRFLEEMSQKHKVKIDRLNVHITDGTLYVQEYDAGRYETFKLLEMHDFKKDNYSKEFITWRDRFFDYETKLLEYKSKSRGNIYSVGELEKMYTKAMLESPHNGV
jgi:hypothetical protein